ncbi:MAG: radical SAM protein [Nitrospirota bacterium]
MNITTLIKMLFLLLTKGLKSNLDMIRLTNLRCHNSEKVIGWHKGYPSFSLLTPPVLSSASTNGISTRLASLYQWRSLPELINIAVTDECNCSCHHCSFLSMKKEDRLLTTEEVKSVVKQAQQLGVASVNFLGGEPLLRDDIVELVGYVNKRLSQVIMFTNGYFLEERIADLKAAGLTSVIVSIDSFRPEVHDAKRGLTGLFPKAIKGIKAAQKLKLLVGISTVVTKDDIANGNLDNLIEMGKSLKVNEIIVFDAIPTGGYLCRQNLIGDQPHLEDLIALSEKYNRDSSYPGIYAYSYAKSPRGLGCLGGVSYFYVSPYGDVCPCDFNPMSVGNIRNSSLPRLWDSMSGHKEFARSSWHGCKMQDRRFREEYRYQIENKRFDTH